MHLGGDNSIVDISARLAQANGRLKSANIGVVIEQRGERLILRATFPPKPGSSQKKPSQQRLALGVRANPAGLKEAELEARKIGALLECKEFSWEPYLRVTANVPQSCQEWIEKFKVHYLQEGGNPDTWEGDYWKILKRLAPDHPLTPEILNALVLGTEANTKTRKRACMAVTTLAKFAGVDYNPSALAGTYGPKGVSPRDLPDDKTIAEWFYKIKNEIMGLCPKE